MSADAIEKAAYLTFLLREDGMNSENAFDIGHALHGLQQDLIDYCQMDVLYPPSHPFGLFMRQAYFPGGLAPEYRREEARLGNFRKARVEILEWLQELDEVLA